MNVTLIHPQHGRKVATLQAEVDADLAHGWIVEGQDVVTASPAPRRRRQKLETATDDGSFDLR